MCIVICSHSQLVTKTDDSKKMIVLEVCYPSALVVAISELYCAHVHSYCAHVPPIQVIDYHKKAQRNPTNLKLSDVALTAVIQRVTSTLSTPFLANVLVRLCGSHW